MALEITDATFDEVVLKSSQPVLVDFWAEWCGPCRMVGPIIDELSQDYEGKAVVGKVDVDNNQEFAAKYGVRNIPTVLLFKNGELVDRKVGVSPKAAQKIIWMELVDVFQLKTADFQHIYLVSVCYNGFGKTVANIPCQPHVYSPLI